MSAGIEMPRYQAHKKVWALEISKINRMTPGKVILSFRDKGYDPMTFDENDLLFARYAPIQGDFYVVYDDGYKSLSPRKAFLEEISVGISRPHTFSYLQIKKFKIPP